MIWYEIIYTDDKADKGSHSEDRPCGRHVGLKFTLEFEQLRLSQDRNAGRHGQRDRPLHAGRIAARGQLDDTELDIRRRPARIGQQFRESKLSDPHGAVVLEIGADGKAPDNFDLAAV